MLYRVKGIVIRSMDYGENSKIITLCTENNSNIGIVMRGVKKTKYRYADLGHLFTYGQYLFFYNKGLGTFQSGEVIASNHRIRENIIKVAYASYACELLYRIVQEEKGTFWFSQLRAYLSALSDDKDAEIVTALYEMKVLQKDGYAPQLEVCVNCSYKGEPQQAYICPRLGGIVCSSCKCKYTDVFPTSKRTVSLLKMFLRLNMTQIGSIRVSIPIRTEVTKIMRLFMDSHFGLPLKSLRFIDQLHKYNWEM